MECCLPKVQIPGFDVRFADARQPDPSFGQLNILRPPPRILLHSHNVVETSTPPLCLGCSSLAGSRLADPLLRRRCRRQRNRKGTHRCLRPRWHLCHCPGTSPRRFLPKSKIPLELHQTPSSGATWLREAPYKRWKRAAARSGIKRARANALRHFLLFE